MVQVKGIDPEKYKFTINIESHKHKGVYESKGVRLMWFMKG